MRMVTPLVAENPGSEEFCVTAGRVAIAMDFTPAPLPLGVLVVMLLPAAGVVRWGSVAVALGRSAR